MMMGFPDYIVCEYPLPFPDGVKELKKPPQWNKFDFQTYDMAGFGGSFDKYSISEDGQFYLESDGIEKQEITREITLYGLHMENDYDYEFSFKVLFWKGELKETHLEEWKRINNEERKKVQKMLEKNLEKFRGRTKKWWFKPLLFYRGVVGFIFYLIKWFLTQAANLCWKIEKWIT